MFGGTKFGSASQTASGVPAALRHAASVVQTTLASCEQCPGANAARPRRSIVFRRLEPNCEKSHVRPSWPPKSGWHDVHASEPPSRAVLTTSPWCFEPSVGSVFHGGMGLCAPFASRADVENRILPS